MIVEHVTRMMQALGKWSVDAPVSAEFAGHVLAGVNSASAPVKACINRHGDPGTVEADAATLWLWTYSETPNATLRDALLPLLEGRNAAASEVLRLFVQCWGV